MINDTLQPGDSWSYCRGLFKQDSSRSRKTPIQIDGLAELGEEVGGWTEVDGGC